MQVLTGQYPTLYTHKFRFEYTDFQPSSLKTVSVPFLTLRPATQVVFVQIKVNTIFDGGGCSVASLAIHQSDNLPATYTSLGSFVTMNLRNPIGNYMGVSNWIPTRTRSGGSPNYNVICNQVVPFSLVAMLNITSPTNISGLTQGSFDIWVTTMRTP